MIDLQVPCYVVVEVEVRHKVFFFRLVKREKAIGHIYVIKNVSFIQITKNEEKCFDASLTFWFRIRAEFFFQNTK